MPLTSAYWPVPFTSVVQSVFMVYSFCVRWKLVPKMKTPSLARIHRSAIQAACPHSRVSCLSRQQPLEDLSRMTIGWKHGVPNMLHSAVADHECQPAQQCLTGCSESGQAHGLRQREIRIGQHRKGQVKSGGKFFLVGSGLG